MPPTALPIIDVPGIKARYVVNLNISGSGWGQGENQPIASYVAAMTRENVNIITLQEVCSGQHSAIRNALGSKWTDSFKNFGRVEECKNGKFGLSTFTKGWHGAAEWWYLPKSPLGDLDKTNPETKNDGAWGMLKVRFRGVDVYNVHVRSYHRREQIPRTRGEESATRTRHRRSCRGVGGEGRSLDNLANPR